MAETEGRSLEVQEKKELLDKEEKTVPARYYLPKAEEAKPRRIEIG